MKQCAVSAAAFIIIILLLQAGPVPVAGQSQATLRTSWGEPDLQGIWVDNYQTPLQRPAQYAGKEFFTDEEREALDARRAQRLDRDYRNLEKYPKGTVNDLQGSYNGVYHMMKRTGRRTSLVVDPPDGRIPPLTPEAQNRQQSMRAFILQMMQASPACQNQEPGCRGGKYAPRWRDFDAAVPPVYSVANINRSYNPEDRSLSERCLAGFVPGGAESPGFNSANGFARRIVQTAGGIAMFYDVGQGQGFHRTVVMHDAPHVPSHIRQWWGDSRGRWEGDTLVVDVTNFSPKTDLFGSRGDNLRVVERYTRTGPDTLAFEATFTDPATWTRPWTVKMEYHKQDEQLNRIYTEPRCHEGNYGMASLLRGARVDDQKFAVGTGPHPAELCTDGCGYVDPEDTSEQDPLR